MLALKQVCCRAEAGPVRFQSGRKEPEQSVDMSGGSLLDKQKCEARNWSITRGV